MKKIPIKTVVIGAGNMGQNHLRLLSSLSQLAAVSDVNKTIGLETATKYNLTYYADYKKMLDTEKPGAVTVAVPTALHYAVARSCLKRKIPTLIEKPIAQNTTEAKRLIQFARDQRTFLMVGHVERFNPAVQKLKLLMQKGKIGRVIHIMALRVGVAPPKSIGADVSLDLSIHDIDVCNYLLDEYPVNKKVISHQIYPHNHADAATVVLEYPKTTAVLQTNWFTPTKLRKLYLMGTEGFAELDYIKQKITLYGRAIGLNTLNSFYDLLSVSDIPTREIYASRKEPLLEELTAFLKKDPEKISSLQSAFEALKVVSL